MFRLVTLGVFVLIVGALVFMFVNSGGEANMSVAGMKDKVTSTVEGLAQEPEKQLGQLEETVGAVKEKVEKAAPGAKGTFDKVRDKMQAKTADGG